MDNNLFPGEIGATGKQIAGTAQVRIVRGYGRLFDVLIEALNQAQNGKGAERHNLGGDMPFERQRMQTISELIGSGDGMAYQAVKKITEGMKLPTCERQVAELLGAINYLAGLVIYLRKQEVDRLLGKQERTNVGSDGLSDQDRAAMARDLDEAVKAGTMHEPMDAYRVKGTPIEKKRSEELHAFPAVKPGDSDTDPYLVEYPIVPSIGWTAVTLDDMFAVMDKLNRHLARGDDSEGLQILTRVWRIGSPLLNALSECRSEINDRAQSKHKKVKPRPQPTPRGGHVQD